MEPFGLIDDVDEARLERLSVQKTPEELEQLTIDEKLSDIERAIHILGSGQDLQRISVINSLSHLLNESQRECIQKVVPKLKEYLVTANPEIQLAASSSFVNVLRCGVKPNPPTPSFAVTFLPTILTSIEHKDPEIASMWLSTLLDSIEFLPVDVMKTTVLDKAMKKGEISQSIQSRLASCRILGKLAPCLDSYSVKVSILPLVQALCQDVEYDVRACMCRQLDDIAKGVGLEVTKTSILPELVELANDEEGSVRLAGLETIVNCLTLLDKETCTSIIIPLLTKFCEQALHGEDTTLPVISKQLGPLCHSLADNLNRSQKTWFLEYFQNICLLGTTKGSSPSRTAVSLPPVKRDTTVAGGSTAELRKDVPQLFVEESKSEQCRKNAAYNFPAMALFAESPAVFEAQLYSSFSRLCTDENKTVRQTMSLGFHEVAKSLGSHVALLVKDMTFLFKDTAVEVVRGLVHSMPLTFTLLGQANALQGAEARLSGLSELMSAVLSCEAVVFNSRDWRLQERFMENLSFTSCCFPGESIQVKFIPLLFSKLHSARARPVRLATANTLLVLLRQTKKQDNRKEVCSRINQEFGSGKSCHSRSLFIDICKMVLDMFSKQYFKEYFYETAIDLASDPVPNIRFRLCSVLPQLKRTIKLPQDRNRLQQLESCVRKLLINERDTDVLETLKSTVEVLDSIHCPVETLNSRKELSPEDNQDKRKFEEEKELIDQEEREKKEEEAKNKEKKGGPRKSIDKSKSKLSTSRIPTVSMSRGSSKSVDSHHSGGGHQGSRLTPISLQSGAINKPGGGNSHGFVHVGTTFSSMTSGSSTTNNGRASPNHHDTNGGPMPTPSPRSSTKTSSVTVPQASHRSLAGAASAAAAVSARLSKSSTGTENRRHSKSGIVAPGTGTKKASSATKAPGGSSPAPPTSASLPAGGLPGATRGKMISSNRNLGSASSVSSVGSVGSAGSTRSGTSHLKKSSIQSTLKKK